MSTIVFRRPARRLPPEMPGGELPLQEPPTMSWEPAGNLGLLLTLLQMAPTSSLMILMIVRLGTGGSHGSQAA
jgi:S-DNA-T family DNA segregation ATPase FtsK/SpoIIIE